MGLGAMAACVLAASAKAPAQELVDAFRGDGGAVAVEHVIALLPDPADPAFDYVFDRYVDSISLALQTDGYVQDTHRVPEHGAPGAILFRKTDPTGTKLFTVTLVSERPTSGVDREGLRAALETAAPDGGPGCAGQLRILGPTFSGSALSVASTLEQWARGGARAAIRVRSGSATDFGNLAAFQRVNAALSDAGSCTQVDFGATMLPDSVLEESLWAYLRASLGPEHGETRPNLVVLHEASTTYALEAAGRGCPDFLRCSELSFPMHIASLRSAHDSDPKRPADHPELQRRLLELQLKSPDAKSDAYPTHSATTPFSLDLVLGSLLTRLAAEGPQFVMLVATDSRDSMFLAEEIRRYLPEARLIFLDADLLFTHDDLLPALSGAIVASTYPLALSEQTRMQPFDSAQRLQFPSAGSEGVYNAMLLLLGRDGALKDYGVPLPGLEGELAYDAGWLSRRVTDGVLAPPVDAPTASRPVAWLSAVGKGGFYALKSVDPARPSADAGEYQAYVAAVAPQHDAQPQVHAFAGGAEPGGLVSLHFLCVLVVLLCCAGYAAARSARVAFRHSFFRLGFSVFHRVTEEGAGYYRFFCAAFFLLLSALYGYLSLVHFTRAWIREDLPRVPLIHGDMYLAEMIHRFLAVLAWVALSAALASALKAFVPRLRERSWQARIEQELLKEKDGRWLRATKVMVAASTAAVLWAVGFVALTLLVPATWRAVLWFLSGPGKVEPTRLDVLYFYDRAANLASGVSPVPVAVFTAGGGLLWFFFWLRRLRIRREFLETRALDEVDLGCIVGSDRATQLEHTLGKQVFKLPTWGVILAVFMGIAALVGVRLVPPFEGDGPGLAQYVMVCVIYFAIIAALVRVQVIWFELTRFLERLEIHPLREAMLRLPPGLLFDGTRPSERMFAAAVRAWRALKGEKGGPDDLTEPLAWPPTAEGMRALFDQTPKLRVATRRALGWLIKAPPAGPASERAEDLVALQLAYTVRHARNQMHNALYFVTAGVLVLMLLTTLYPFRYQQAMGVFTWAGVIAAIVATSWLLIEMSRNEMLSVIAKTAPGQVTVDRTLVGGLLTHGALPLIGLLATQFPVVGRWAADFVGPLLQAFVK